MRAKLLEKKTLIIIFFLVLLASVFRITNLDVIEFKDDEAINLFLASRPLFGHPIPAGATVSSIGILNPPLLNYIIFPITLISLDPRYISFAIGLLNTFFVGIFFLFVNKFYNQSIALYASLLLATSAWIILYSRKIWAQDFIIPFLIVFFYCLHTIMVKQKQIFLIPLIISALFLIQIYPSSLIFFVLLLITFLIQKFIIDSFGKMRFTPKRFGKNIMLYIVIGIVIGLAPLIPYVQYQFTNNCPDCSFTQIARQQSSNLYSFQHFFRPFQIINSGNFYFILGDDMSTLASWHPIIYKARALFYLEYLLLPIGLIIFWSKYQKFRFVIYTLVLLPCIYFLLKIEPQMHYFIILTPFLFIFLGEAFNSLIISKNKTIKMTALVIFCLIIAESIAFNYVFYSVLSTKKVLKGDYGSSYAIGSAEVEKLLKNYKNEIFYHELRLATHIPKDRMYGHLPLARMLYDSDVTEKRINEYDRMLKKVPVDARIQNELLAFYTKTPPTKETIGKLRLKSTKNKGYITIYEYAYKLYLSNNLLMTHRSTSFDLSFEYPQHWVLIQDKKDTLMIRNEENEIVILKNLETENLDKYGFEAGEIKIPKLNLTLKKYECRTNNKWCGTLLQNIKIGDNNYLIIYEPLSKDAFELGSKKQFQAQRISDWIVSSIH